MPLLVGCFYVPLSFEAGKQFCYVCVLFSYCFFESFVFKIVVSFCPTVRGHVQLLYFCIDSLSGFLYIQFLVDRSTAQHILSLKFEHASNWKHPAFHDMFLIIEKLFPIFWKPVSTIGNLFPTIGNPFPFLLETFLFHSEMFLFQMETFPIQMEIFLNIMETNMHCRLTSILANVVISRFAGVIIPSTSRISQGTPFPRIIRLTRSPIGV